MPGVDVHAAVVLGGLHVAGHRRRLRVLAEHVGSSYAVPGARIERRATPWTLGVNSPAPISQSAAAASWPSERCLTSEPKTSDTLSFSAPDCPWYDQPGGQLGHAVGELVAHHVDGDR